VPKCFADNAIFPGGITRRVTTRSAPPSEVRGWTGERTIGSTISQGEMSEEGKRDEEREERLEKGRAWTGKEEKKRRNLRVISSVSRGAV
jgi:hypothetical protein